MLVVELLTNLLVPTILAKIYHLNNLQAGILILGTTLIDFDHILYYVTVKKSLFGMKKFFKENYKLHQPFFYIFHTFEFLTISLYLSYLTKSPLMYLFLGFWLNFAIDILTYLLVYKSTKPWLRYFFGMRFILTNIAKTR